MIINMRMLLRLKRDDAIRIIEDALRVEGVKFEKKRYYTRPYGLRMMEFLTERGKIKLIFYEDKTSVVIPRKFQKLAVFLSPYEIRKEQKERDPSFELRVYSRKLKHSFIGIIHVTLTLSIPVLIFSLAYGLDGSLITFVLPIAVLISLFAPLDISSSPLLPYAAGIKPLEDLALPLLIPYYYINIKYRKAKSRNVKY